MDATPVRVLTQIDRADIVAEVGEQLVLLIEDKAHAGLHGDQLARYRQAMDNRYPEKKVLLVFLKTGDQSSYTSFGTAGYRTFLRGQLLDLLRPWRVRVDNAILADFVDHLEERDAAVEAYSTESVSDWVENGYP